MSIKEKVEFLNTLMESIQNAIKQERAITRMNETEFLDCLTQVLELHAEALRPVQTKQMQIGFIRRPAKR